MIPHYWRSIGKLGVISGVAALVVSGIFLWASHSWYVCVWSQAKRAFPQAKVHIMVNDGSEDYFRLAAKYRVEANLALNALVFDGSDKLIATAWREGYLRYPDSPDANDARLEYAYSVTLAQMEAGHVFGWTLFGLGSPTALYALLSWDRRGLPSPTPIAQVGRCPTESSTTDQP